MGTVSNGYHHSWPWVWIQILVKSWQRQVKEGIKSCRLYHIMGYLHEAQIFKNFTNAPTSHENLCWAISKVRLWVLVGAWNN